MSKMCVRGTLTEVCLDYSNLSIRSGPDNHNCRQDFINSKCMRSNSTNATFFIYCHIMFFYLLQKKKRQMPF